MNGLCWGCLGMEGRWMGCDDDEDGGHSLVVKWKVVVVVLLR
jgi:hypothetical protein